MAEYIEFPGPFVRILTALIGVVVLISGRRLFWLTVAVIGFIAGLILTLVFLEIQPAWLAWLIAVVAGGVGALLAIFLQRVAVIVAGFVMGGIFLVWVVNQFLNLNLDGWGWLIYLIGGVLGAILASSLFDVALIVLSSLAGAALIVAAANFGSAVTTLLLIILLIVGIVIQSRRLDPSSSL